MNSRDTLQQISEYLTGQGHCLFGRLSDDPKALSLISDEIIGAAEELKRLKRERLNKLSQFGPRVHEMACGEIIVTLLRQGDEEFYYAGEHSISVEWTSRDEVREHFKLRGPPENDGNTYMLRFRPIGIGPQEYAIQISAWEADIINKELNSIYRDRDPY